LNPGTWNRDAGPGKMGSSTIKIGWTTAGSLSGRMKSAASANVSASDWARTEPAAKSAAASSAMSSGERCAGKRKQRETDYTNKFCFHD
jgi:hypothetical protein